MRKITRMWCKNGYKQKHTQMTVNNNIMWYTFMTCDKSERQNVLNTFKIILVLGSLSSASCVLSSILRIHTYPIPNWEHRLYFWLVEVPVPRDWDVDVDAIGSMFSALTLLAAFGMTRRRGICGSSVDKKSFDFKSAKHIVWRRPAGRTKEASNASGDPITASAGSSTWGIISSCWTFLSTATVWRRLMHLAGARESAANSVLGSLSILTFNVFEIPKPL